MKNPTELVGEVWVATTERLLIYAAYTAYTFLSNNDITSKNINHKARTQWNVQVLTKIASLACEQQANHEISNACALRSFKKQVPKYRKCQNEQIVTQSLKNMSAVHPVMLQLGK